MLQKEICEPLTKRTVIFFEVVSNEVISHVTVSNNPALTAYDCQNKLPFQVMKQL